MINKRLLTITLGFLLTLSGQSVAQSAKDLRLTLRPERGSYLLGEELKFNFELKNNGSILIEVLDVFAPPEGLLTIKCSRNGKDYFDCGKPGWGTLDTNSSSKVAPGSSIYAEGSTLWTWPKQDETAFMFVDAGPLYVKAVYNTSIAGPKGELVIGADGEARRTLIESAPIMIELNEPKGEDLAVWKEMQKDGNFAYFLMMSELRIPSNKRDERSLFIQKVRDLVREHPDSIYSETLRKNLVKYFQNEARMLEIQEKMKRGKP